MFVGRRAVAPTVVVGVVVAVVIVGAGAFFLLSQPAGSSTTSPSTSQTTTSTTSTTSSTSVVTTTQSSATFDQSLFTQHLQTIDARLVNDVTDEYTSDAKVVWSGHAAGLEGTYSGQGNIRLLYSSALSNAKTINLVPSGVTVVKNTGTQVVVNSTLAITGTSGYLGPFNGTILASTTFANVGGTWKISSESWNFKVLNTSASGGATTFPEWQKVGEPITTRRSSDWLHNFAWDFGGPGVAFLIWGYLLLVGLLVVMKTLRKPAR